MDNVVDMKEWLGSRKDRNGTAQGLGRLERAVERLDPLASQILEGRGRLEPAVETELLAIMGALGIGLLDTAAERAERLAGALAGRIRTGDGSLG